MLNRVLVLSCFVLSSFAVASPATIQASNSIYPMGEPVCAMQGADLFVALGTGPNSAQGFYKMTLRNYRSVLNNSSAAELEFQIDDPSVGAVSFQDRGGLTWELNRQTKGAGGAYCQVKVSPGSETVIDVFCSKISTSGKNGREGRLALDERPLMDLRIASFSCRVERDSRP